MSSVGPNSPSTVVSTGIGTAWSNPSNAVSSNNSYASAAIPAGGTTRGLKATGFGFSIPSGSTINGVVVTAEAKSGVDGDFGLPRCGDYMVKLNVPDLESIWGENSGDRAVGGTYTSSDSNVVHGSESDLWDYDLTVDIINDSRFGVWIRSQNNYSATITAYIDHITITVSYTLSGTTYNESVTISADGTITSTPAPVYNSGVSVAGDASLSEDSNHGMHTPATVSGDATVQGDSSMSMESGAGIDSEMQVTGTASQDMVEVSIQQADGTFESVGNVDMIQAATIEGDVHQDADGGVMIPLPVTIEADMQVTGNESLDIIELLDLSSEGMLESMSNAEMQSAVTVEGDALIQSESIMFVAASLSLDADNTILIGVDVTHEATTTIDALIENGASGEMLMEAQMLCTADTELTIVNSLEMVETLPMYLDGMLSVESTSSMETVVALTLDADLALSTAVDALVTCRMDAAALVEGSALMALQEVLDLITECALASKGDGTIHTKKIFNAGEREAVLVSSKPKVTGAKERVTIVTVKKKPDAKAKGRNSKATKRL